MSSFISPNYFSVSSLFFNMPIVTFWLITIIIFFLLDIYTSTASYFNTKHTYLNTINKNTILLTSILLSFTSLNMKKGLKCVYAYSF